MKTTTNRRPHTVPTFAEYLYQTAHVQTHIAIRAKYAKSGLDFLGYLDMEQYRDRHAERMTDYANTAAAARAEHDEYMSMAQEARKERDKAARRMADLTAAPESRAAARTAYEAYEATRAKYADKAADMLADAQEIEKRMRDFTAGDRESIVHDAIAATLEAMSGKDWSDKDERDEAFFVGIRAAGRQVSALAAAKGHPHNRTKLQHESTLTDEQREKYAPLLDGSADKIPFSVRGGLSAGWYTRDYKAYKTTKSGKTYCGRPAGWYITTHYKTYAPAALDEATEQAAPDAVELAAAVDVEAFSDRAKLSARERDALRLLAEDNTTRAARRVQAYGVAVVDAWQTRTAERIAAAETQKQRNRIRKTAEAQTDKRRRTAMLNAAFATVGIKSKNARYQAAHRIRRKLDKALTAPEVIPAAVTMPEAAPIVPTVRAYTTKAAPTEYSRMRFTWREDSPAPEAITAAERAAMEAARAEAEAERKARAAAYMPEQTRREYMRAFAADAAKGGRTAYAAHDARAVAFRMVERMTAAEQAAHVAAVYAERAAEAEQTAAAALAKAREKREADKLTAAAASLTARAREAFAAGLANHKPRTAYAAHDAVTAAAVFLAAMSAQERAEAIAAAEDMPSAYAADVAERAALAIRAAERAEEQARTDAAAEIEAAKAAAAKAAALAAAL